jgi:hypothetical protein
VLIIETDPLLNKSVRTPQGRESWNPQPPPSAAQANSAAAEAYNFYPLTEIHLQPSSG